MLHQPTITATWTSPNLLRVYNSVVAEIDAFPEHIKSFDEEQRIGHLRDARDLIIEVDCLLQAADWA